MAHRLGFAVKVLGDGGLPSHDARRWRSEPHLRVSLERLAAVFDYLESKDLRMYRMSSDLVPYGAHPDLTQFHGQVDECAAELAELGGRARALDLRLSFHPAQYIVLNSEDEAKRAVAALDLDLEAAVLDALGAGPEAVVVLHVGGAAGGREAAFERFLDGFERLGESARRRLVLENDDSRFGLTDVLDLGARTGLRVVWDAHHHNCFDPAGIPPTEALRLALATWPAEQTPKIHYSSPRTAVGEREKKVGRRVERQIVLPPLSAHADLIDPTAFADFLRGPGTAAGRDFDVMVEAKAKDLAVLRLREQLRERGFGWDNGALV